MLLPPGGEGGEGGAGGEGGGSGGSGGLGGDLAAGLEPGEGQKEPG